MRQIVLIAVVNLFAAAGLWGSIERGALIDDVRQVVVVVDKVENCPARINWDMLESDIQVKLTDAGFERPAAPERAKSPTLRAAISVLETEPDKICVISCRLSLERLVCVPEKPEIVIMAPVWESAMSMQALAIADVNTAITSTIEKQVEAFIKAHHAAMIKARAIERQAKAAAPADNTNPAGPKDIAKPQAIKASADDVTGIYVCSKSSKVYHKAGCSGASRIMEQNKISFNSKTEAGQSGRRPCKICNP